MTKSHKSLDKPSRVEQFLIAVVDLSILGSIFFVPLLLGGRHPLGQLLLVILAVGGTLAWTARRSLQPRSTWRISKAEPLLIAAVALLVVQVTPLPEGLLAWLRGDAARTLHLWTAQDTPGHMGAWPLVSLAPQATREALVMFLAYSMFFILIVQRVQSLSDVERLLRMIALAAVAMAGFGLVQLLLGNGRYFWFLEHASGSTEGAACGSFLNRNHFAHFLALGIGPIVWCAVDAARESRDARPAGNAVLRWSALAVVLVAVLLSLSRGGSAAAVLALATIAFVYYRLGAINTRTLAAMGGVLVLVVATLAMLGHQRVAARMDDWLTGSVQSLDRDAQRRIVWTATAAAGTQNKLVGTGVGSHRYVCPLYLDAEKDPAYVESAGRYFSAHADNGPLEIFEETGILGLTILAAAVGMTGFWCMGGFYRSQSRRLSLALGAVAASLVASAAHNLVDCPWYVPGCMAVVVILLAAACRLFQLSGDDDRRRAQRRAMPRGFALGATIIVLMLGCWMMSGRIGPLMSEPHWNDYRLRCRASIARDASCILPDEISELSENGPNCETKCEADRRLASGVRTTVEKMIDALENVVRLDPQRTDARVQLAGVYLLLFECKQADSQLNRMPLSALRGAVAASDFQSQRELEDWLARAVGPHWRLLKKAHCQARAAAAQCPLQGAAYVYLSQLCFLEGGDPQANARAYMKQALAVRPFDGAILLAAANEAVLEGDFDHALELWKRSYRAGRVHQRELVRRLVGQIAPQDTTAEINFFLDNFQPDLHILRQLEKAYTALAVDDLPPQLWQAHAEAVEAEAERLAKGQEAADLWLEARLVQVKLGNQQRAVDCLRQALQCDPSSYKAHYRLAVALSEMQDTQEARRHLEWCLARNPNDRSSRRMMEKLLRESVTSQAACTTAESDKLDCAERTSNVKTR